LATGAGPKEVIAAYREHAKGKTDEERGEGKVKTGVFIGAYAINPVTGGRIPIFIADYVLAGYGTGGIMAVPAHDERDFAFAKAFGLQVIEVVQPPAGVVSEGCFCGEGFAINSPPVGKPSTAFAINGLTTADATKKMIEALHVANYGRKQVNYKLRDWLFSRQRYWGEPFPIVYDQYGTPIALPEDMLPVLLPEMENFQPESSEDPDAPPRPPLARAKEWCTVELDLDGQGARTYTRETNTMPNWAGSCWYYLRYLDPDNSKQLISKEADKYWMNSGKPGGVDLYVGGVEHAVLHLLYSRFWHKVLFDLGYVSTSEPFQRLFNQGYIQAAAFKDKRGIYVPAADVTEGAETSIEVDRLTLPSGEEEPVMRATTFHHNGEPVFREYGKMGKSLKNAVAPDEVCAEYGCDTLRIYEMAMGPLEASKPWNTRDITGSYRFLQRVWRTIIDETTGACRISEEPAELPIRRLVAKTIFAVRRDMASLGFNTAIAKLIELNNELTKVYSDKPCPREVAEALTLMLSPLAPHMAEELWARLGHSDTIIYASFPEADKALLVDDSVELPVQVNGKVRGRITVATGADDETVTAAALANAEVAKWVDGKPIKMCKVIKGKMVTLAV